MLLLASSRSLKSNALELHLMSAHGCIGCMQDSLRYFKKKKNHLFKAFRK